MHVVSLYFLCPVILILVSVVSLIVFLICSWYLFYNRLLFISRLPSPLMFYNLNKSINKNRVNQLKVGADMETLSSKLS